VTEGFSIRLVVDNEDWEQLAEGYKLAAGN
jgi:hypothetical protein